MPSISKSLRVPAAREALEVGIVTGARGLCSLLVPAARGALEVEVVAGARGGLLAPRALPISSQRNAVHEVGLLDPRAPPSLRRDAALSNRSVYSPLARPPPSLFVLMGSWLQAEALLTPPTT